MKLCLLHALAAVLLGGIGSYAAPAAPPPPPSVVLPSVLSSNMVLAAEPELARIWGWASRPGDKVAVTIQFGNGSTARLPAAVSNSTTGKFEVTFSAAVSLAPANITINNDVALQDVLFGVLVLCGGKYPSTYLNHCRI